MTDKIRAALVDYREMAVTKLAIRDADEALREYDARATPALPYQPDEIPRLVECLKKANEQAEHFERQYYLICDKVEELESRTPALPQGVEEWIEENGYAGAKLGAAWTVINADDLRAYLSGMAIVPVVNIKSIVRDFEHHGRETPIRVEPFVRVNFAHEDYDSRDTFHAMLAAAKEKGFKKRELDVVELEAYDAGYLSSYGEGNVQWWHDYMRAELERARTFYEQQVEQMLSGMAIVPVERLKYLNDHHHATESGVGLARLALSRGDTQRAIEALNSTSEKLDSILDVLAAAKEPATCSVCGLKRSDTKNCKAPDCSPMREKE